jgi:hypothetical protein
MENNYKQIISNEEKTRSLNAIKTLNELRSTYSFEKKNTRYLLASKTQSLPCITDRKILVEELYSTSEGLIKKVEERTRTVPMERNIKPFSQNISHSPTNGEFPIRNEDLSNIIVYFDLKPGAVFSTIDKIEKELGIDIDKANLLTNSQDTVFFNQFF